MYIQNDVNNICTYACYVYRCIRIYIDDVIVYIDVCIYIHNEHQLYIDDVIMYICIYISYM